MPDTSLPLLADRICLRRLRTEDLTDFQAYRQDESVARYQGWSPVPDAEARSFLEEMAMLALFQPGVWFQLGITDRSDKLIGDIGINLAQDLSEAEIGFSLRAESQGRGLASEMVDLALTYIFESTKAHRVIAITDARNEPCIRLLERCGMRRSKELKSIFQGEPCREYLYEIAREHLGK